jgi:hypothetical protein
MRMLKKSRGAVLLALLAGGWSFAQQHRVGPRPIFAMRSPPQQAPAPVVRLPPPGLQSQQTAPGERRAAPQYGANPPRNGEHLAQWMDQHRSLSPEQQQQALGAEPGFHELPPETQQHIRERLAQLNAMSPQQRQRWERHTEAMERLTLPERAQVRGVMQQLGSLPPPQREFVARSFRQLRQLPPGQRPPLMNAYRSQMNAAQRSTLNNLMRIEPMIPPD